MTLQPELGNAKRPRKTLKMEIDFLFVFFRGFRITFALFAIPSR